MTPYSVVVLLAIAANVWILGFVALRMNRRLPRNALVLLLGAFIGSHVVTLGLAEGAIPASSLGLGFAALVLGYTSLALFVVLFLYGESLRRRIPTIAVVLVPGMVLASLGALSGWSPADAFRLATDPVSVAINGYLVMCLAVALAEALAVWRRSPGRAPEAFPLVAGSVALIVAGPIYGFELVVLDLQEFTGTNLGVPVAGALFALAMARGNPLPFHGRTPEGSRRVPWTVVGGAYLIEETRPKYAQAMFLAASHESPALAVLSEPEAWTPDLAGVESVRLPPGERCASVLAGTIAEFLQRHRTGAVLVNDASYAVANSGRAATVEAIRRVVAGIPETARIVVSLSKLTAEERTDFGAVRGTRATAPDVEAELASILERHLGAAKCPLARAALARGKRVEDLSLVDLPSVRDYVLASLSDLRAPSDEAADSGWHRVSMGLASDLEALWRTPPTEPRARPDFHPAAEAAEIPVVRAADVLPSRETRAPRPTRPLGTAVREAFLGALGPAGEPVYRRVMGRLRKEASALRPEDIPRVAQFAEEALQDLRAAIDVLDAKRDLVNRAARLRAHLDGLAKGEP